MSKKYEVRFAYKYEVVVSVEADTDDEALLKARELVDESIELTFDDTLVDDVTVPEEVGYYSLFYR